LPVLQGIYCFENIMDIGRSQGIVNEQQPVLCKPNKQCFQLVLDQIGAAAQSTIFIDDSVRNVAAAHEMGVFSVLVSPALAAQQSPHQHVAGADLVVASFNQLREVLPQVSKDTSSPDACCDLGRFVACELACAAALCALACLVYACIVVAHSAGTCGCGKDL
jgi:hypothetical protein